MNTVKIAIVYCSRYGHTKRVADAVFAGAKEEPETEVKLYTTEEAIEKIAELDSADAILFGAPTYMGNMASEMKRFLETTVGRWLNRAWQDKIAGGFTNSANFSGDKLNTLQGIMISAMQLGMIWISLNSIPGEDEAGSEDSIQGPSPEAVNRNGGSLGPMASSFNVRTPDAPAHGDLNTAQKYGKRVAHIARVFAAGKHKLS